VSGGSSGAVEVRIWDLLWHLSPAMVGAQGGGRWCDETTGAPPRSRVTGGRWVGPELADVEEAEELVMSSLREVEHGAGA
jgi:hypothetical protein